MRCLALALVLVFAVTRVILIPQGEFVTYGALSYAMLATGNVPGTVVAARSRWARLALAFDLFAARARCTEGMAARFALNIVLPLAILALTCSLAGAKMPIAVNIVLALLIVSRRSGCISTASPSSRWRTPRCWCC